MDSPTPIFGTTCVYWSRVHEISRPPPHERMSGLLQYRLPTPGCAQGCVAGALIIFLTGELRS